MQSGCLDLEEHEVLGLIGPNGAGKTSLFNCITGFYKPSKGTIRLDGTNIVGRRPYQISRLGIRRTFQNIRLFSDLTVAANILAGAHTSKERHELVDKVFALCDELELQGTILDRRAGELPYGLQRRVELARALIADPRLLLVDEPGAGLNAGEKRLIVTLLRRVARSRNIGVILIEHDIGMIAEACDGVCVLDRGHVIATGTPAEVRKNPTVVDAYLGGGPL